MDEITPESVIATNELAIAQLAEMKERIEMDLPQLGAEIAKMCSRSFVPAEERKEWLEWVAKLIVYHSYTMEMFDTLHTLLSANIETVHALEGTEPSAH